jgi:ArsR family transcriptional regulator
VPRKKQKLSSDALQLVAARFRVLGEPARLELLQSLMEGEKSQQELCEETGLTQANVSKHLALLAEHHMVAKRKEGLFSFYSIDDPSVFELCSIVCGSLNKQVDLLRKRLNP